MLREDREVVLEAVKRNGNALQFASEELRGNHEVVLEAVRQDGSTLQHAQSEGEADSRSDIGRMRTHTEMCWAAAVLMGLSIAQRDPNYWPSAARSTDARREMRRSPPDMRCRRSM